MNNSTPRWQELYQTALLELDRTKLLQYIDLAEHAIREHTNAPIEPVHQRVHELDAMQDALRTLSLLRRNALREAGTLSANR